MELFKTKAERGGFEPPKGCPLLDFESSVFDLSAIFPFALCYIFALVFSSGDYLFFICLRNINIAKAVMASV